MPDAAVCFCCMQAASTTERLFRWVLPAVMSPPPQSRGQVATCDVKRLPCVVAGKLQGATIKKGGGVRSRPSKEAGGFPARLTVWLTPLTTKKEGCPPEGYSVQPPVTPCPRRATARRQQGKGLVKTTSRHGEPTLWTPFPRGCTVCGLLQGTTACMVKALHITQKMCNTYP